MTTMEAPVFIAWTEDRYAVAVVREEAVDALANEYGGDLPPYRVVELTAWLPPVPLTEGVGHVTIPLDKGRPELTVVK